MDFLLPSKATRSETDSEQTLEGKIFAQRPLRRGGFFICATIVNFMDADELCRGEGYDGIDQSACSLLGRVVLVDTYTS